MAYSDGLQTIVLDLSSEDINKIAKAAAKEGLSITTFVRNCALKTAQSLSMGRSAFSFSKLESRERFSGMENDFELNPAYQDCLAENSEYEANNK